MINLVLYLNIFSSEMLNYKNSVMCLLNCYFRFRVNNLKQRRYYDEDESKERDTARTFVTYVNN